MLMSEPVLSQTPGAAHLRYWVGAMLAVAALFVLTGCTNGTYDCEGTALVIDGSRIEYAGADRYEVCQSNGNILVIGFRDQCGTTSRNYMSFDKMQRKLARGTENWDCKKK
jgi:hypothetical protein